MRQLLQWSAAAFVVLLASTTVASAQTDQPDENVQALAKLVEMQDPANLKKDEDGTKYTKDLNDAINKLTDLTQFRYALLNIGWKDVSAAIKRIEASSSTEKDLEKAPYMRLSKSQNEAYANLATRYSKQIETELRQAKVERQRVIALSVLDLSEARSTSSVAMTDTHKSNARAVSGKMIPTLGELIRSNDPVINETVALILARAQTEWGEKPVADAIEHLLVKSSLTGTRLATAKALGVTIQELTPLKPETMTEEPLKAKANILPVLGLSLTDADAFVRVQSMRNVQTITEGLTRTPDDLKGAPAYKSLMGAIGKLTTGPLQKALRDERPLVRTLAALVLEDLAKASEATGKGGDETLDKALVDSLGTLEQGVRDPNIRVRITSLDTLGQMKKLTLPAPAKDTDTDAQKRLRATQIQVRKTIAAAVADTDPFVRWSAARALGQIGGSPPEGAVANLSTLLGDQDPSLQQEAAQTLSFYKEDAAGAVASLGENSTRGDPQSRVEMLKALAAIGPKAKPAIPQIRKSLTLTVERRSNGYPPAHARGDPVPNLPKVRQQAVLTLREFGADAKSALEEALLDPDPDVRRAAGEALLPLK